MEERKDWKAWDSEGDRRDMVHGRASRQTRATSSCDIPRSVGPCLRPISLIWVAPHTSPPSSGCLRPHSPRPTQSSPIDPTCSSVPSPTATHLHWSFALLSRAHQITPPTAIPLGPAAARAMREPPLCVQAHSLYESASRVFRRALRAKITIEPYIDSMATSGASMELNLC